ncbi:UNVERIFIED_CONTAM: hypothetical protein FKN15_040070 [Acipenser sinensis]
MEYTFNMGNRSCRRGLSFPAADGWTFFDVVLLVVSCFEPHASNKKNNNKITTTAMAVLRRKC